MTELKRELKLKTISIVSLVINSMLAVLKIFIGIVSGSFAVIADGIDSFMDMAMSIFMLTTAAIMKKVPNERFPYGYKRAENITTYIITFIIFSVGLQLFIANLKGIMNGLNNELPGFLAVYVTVFSIFGKGILAFWQYREGKKIDSPMVIANAINMRNDIFLSFSVLVGLFATIYLSLPIIDRVIAFMLSLWIMWVAIKLFRENSVDLMDGVIDCTLYNKVFVAVKDIDGVYNPHRIRIRKAGYMYIIDLDIEVEANMTVSESHHLGIKVEKSIKNAIENVYDVMLHIEPIGNQEKGEKYGVSDN